MIVTGITGGIGSGKTTFCRYWEEEGVPVIYLDDYARELMNTDPVLKKQILETFGKAAYTPTGELNRSYLADEAFAKGRVEELNEIVHPAIWRTLDQEIEEFRKQGTEVLAIEAAILLNNGRPDRVDRVIIIESAKEDRINRVRKRDDAGESDVIARMDKQPDFRKLHELADHVITNDGDLTELKNKAVNLLGRIRNRD